MKTTQPPGVGRLRLCFGAILLPRQGKLEQLRCLRLADQRLISVQRSELCQFICGQREIEQGEILPDMLRLGAFGNDGDAFLRQEAEQDLRRGFAVLLCKGKHGRFLEHFILIALAKRRIGHVRHILFVHPAALGAALAVEIRFDLIHCRDDLVVGDQVEQLVRLEVGNADGADYAFCVQLFKPPATPHSNSRTASAGAEGRYSPSANWQVTA